MKRVLIVLLAVLMVFAAGCSKNNVEKVTLKETQTAAPTATAQPTPAPTEKPVYGVEDSIFDDEPAETEGTETEEPAETKEPVKEEKPAETSSSDKKDEEKTTAAPTATAAPTQEPTAAPEKTDAPANTTAPQPTAQPGGSSGSPDTSMDYEAFQALSPADQQVYMESFSDIQAFFDWYNAAKEKHAQEHPDIEIGDGPIDMGEILGGEN